MMKTIVKSVKYGKYFACIFLAVIMSFGAYCGSSLSIGFLYALAIRQNVILSSLAAFAVYLINGGGMRLYACFAATLIIAIASYLVKLTKGKVKTITEFAVSILLGLIQPLFTELTPYGIVTSTLASFVSFFFAKKILDEDFDVGVDSDFSAFLILLCFVTLGIAELKIFSVSLIFAIIPVVVIYPFSVSDREKALATSLAVAFSAYIGTKDFGLTFAIIAFAFSSYICKNRLCAALPVILVGEYALFMYLAKIFISDNVISLLYFAIGSLSTYLLPKSIKHGVAVGSIPEELVNETLKLSAVRLKELSSTYNDIAKSLVIADKIENLPQKIVDSCVNSCGYCKNRNCCEVLKRADENFEPLAISALSKGSINMLDLGDFLYSKCGYTERLISAVNSSAARCTGLSMKQKERAEFNVTMKKLFAGLSEVLSCEAGRLDKNLSFDKKTELDIYEELKLCGIKAKEIYCVRDSVGTPTVKIALDKNIENGKTVVKVISNACGIKMKAVKNAKNGVITYIPKPSCDVAIGISRATKGNEKAASGDNYLIERVADYSYLLALSDGMGTGEDASKSSERAVTAIENLFRAGFSYDLICSLINSVLSFGGGECFAATDIAVIDSVNMTAAVIKLGTPPTFVVKEKVIEFDGDSLPIGILEDVTPTKRSIDLVSGDMIIIMSDGVYDAMKEKTAYYIAKSKKLNPQEMSDYLLKTAIDLNSGIPNDDMTVLAIKIA